jgi:hypothetical protein
MMLFALLTYEKAVGQGVVNKYWQTMNDKVFPPDVIRVVQIVRLDVEVERDEKAFELWNSHRSDSVSETRVAIFGKI